MGKHVRYNCLLDKLNNQLFNQLAVYFSIGLCAALIEWSTFWLSNELLELNIYISTAISFTLATFVNWVLGRKTVFKNAVAQKRKINDAVAVYIVSGIGLLLNMGLMALFADLLGIYPLIAKIISTGIVFFWNFLARKYIIYKIH